VNTALDVSRPMRLRFMWTVLQVRMLTTKPWHKMPRGRPPQHVPDYLPVAKLAGRRTSTQAGFGDILAEIGRGQGEHADLARRIVTTSPDVTVSTNLGPWVNRRGVFDRHTRNDVFRDAKLASAQRWGMAPGGQHIELGIAEQNLFLLLAAAGL